MTRRERHLLTYKAYYKSHYVVYNHGESVGRVWSVGGKTHWCNSYTRVEKKTRKEAALELLKKDGE